MYESDSDEMSFRGLAPDDRRVIGAENPAPNAPMAGPLGAPELAPEAAGTPPAIPAEPPAPLPAPMPMAQAGPQGVPVQAPSPGQILSHQPQEAAMQHPQMPPQPPVAPAAPEDTFQVDFDAPAPPQPDPMGAQPHPMGADPMGSVLGGEPAEPIAAGADAPIAGKKPKVTVEVTGEAAPNSNLSPRHQVQEWLGQMVKNQASDLILRSGGRPSQRLDGRISFLPGKVPGPGPMLEVLRGILGERRMETFIETGSADAALDLDGLGRFRINAYKQMGEPAIVIRRINEDAPSLDDLHLPADELKELALRKRGLVLVTGVAGSGKSTTLAAMIEFMNRNVERHVVTLEDPVELLFKERYCVISQREVGTDTTCFKQGLKHALRQSPDVILIGEMRDAETVLAALEAIETGHMVMSTMHTVNAAQTVDRILGFFPAERHVQIRQRMADTLAGVLSMRLVPRIGGGLVPAYELMQVTPQVRELLEEGKTTELGRVIQGGMERGIVAFNDRLMELVNEGLVDLDEALQTSDRPDELLMRIRGIQGGTRAQAKAAAGPEVDPGHPMRRKSDVPPGEGPADQGGGLRLKGSGPGY